MPMSLNFEQQNALLLVVNGHNMVIIGAAGTGKSYLVKVIVKTLQEKGVKTALTCTTGVACGVYPTTMQPMTIHRWSGIGDGRYQPTEIVNVIRNNPKYRAVVERIKSTDVLIVDECSMMSVKFLETLNEVCNTKHNYFVFGGIQVILVGDFHQLPPVPNVRYDDTGAYCLKGNIFDIAFPHRVLLTTVVRQSDLPLIKAIDEVSKGLISSDTLSLMRTLSRPLKTDDSVKLFSTNELVDDYNRDQILDVPGPLHEYVSSDVGKRKYLSEIQAPRKLWLKIGIPVILIRNISDKLVNGLLGNVYELEFGEIIVNFPFVQDHVIISKVRFEVFNPSTNSVVASREQFPLKPAFGLTIHKAQGMTLESIEVDCRDIFKPGQLGVAMGRIKTIEGLRVINFTQRVCMKHPLEIQNFMSSLPEIGEVKVDFSCCKQQRRSDIDETVFNTSDISEMDNWITEEWDDDINQNDDLNTEDEFGVQDLSEEFDKEFDNIITTIDTEYEAVQLPENLDIKGMLEGLKYLNVITPMQLEINTILSRMDTSAYEKFCKKEYSFVSTLFNDIKPHTSKGLGDFYSKIHSHNNSLEFKINTLKLFQTEKLFTDSHMHITVNTSVGIRKYILAEKAQKVGSSVPQFSQRAMTKASRARVRYIGGYCIAKVRHKNVMKKMSHRYSQNESDKLAYEEAKCAISVLCNLWEEEQFLLASTEEPDSLLDVSRKQNLNRGLTNIPDNLFHFFLQLTEKCLSLLINENLNKMGSKMFEMCQTEIMCSNPLYEFFLKIVTNKSEAQQIIEQIGSSGSVEDLLTDIILQVSQIEIIYKGIIKLFLLVIFNQFRKDLLDNLKVENKMAHRKQVRVSTGNIDNSKKGGKGKTTGKRKRDNEEEKMTERNVVEEGPVCEHLEIDLITDTEYTPTEPEPGPSNETSEETALNNIETEEISDLCLKCQAIKKERDWIQCDSCDTWLHRSCAGLKNLRKWKKYQRKGSTFYCENCL